MGPIIFVHGAGLSSDCWKSQTDFFSGSVAVDLPGHGLSSQPSMDSIGGYASWLGRNIRRNGPDPVVLVGHSMGSLVALETAARNQDMVAGLILIGVSADMSVDPRLLASAKEKDPAAAAMVVKWNLPRAASYGRPKKWVLSLTDEFMKTATSGAMANDLTACDTYGDVLPMAEKVRCPSLLVLGENDVMTRPTAARPLAAALSDARIVVVEMAGHMLPMEKPEEVNEAISLFLTIN
jgi:pimeloyl-ACP methyl ester carboxylesterase